MITHPAPFSELGFYLLAAAIVAAAVSAVTLADARRTALAYFSLSAALGALVWLLSAPAPAVALLTLGALVAALYWRTAINAPRLTVVEPSMEDGPNRPVAVFITLCLTLILMPTWINSVWKSHVMTPLVDVTAGITALAVGEFLPLILAVGVLALFVALVIFSVRAAAPRGDRGDASGSLAAASETEPVS
ncbi:MAG TPA: hypothetical protein VLB27_01510 [candidate division Zixibacteria bacterium]|nr:hypothetical protein [candidate division Zixibacteria bacterium]